MRCEKAVFPPDTFLGALINTARIRRWGPQVGVFPGGPENKEKEKYECNQNLQQIVSDRILNRIYDEGDTENHCGLKAYDKKL